MGVCLLMLEPQRSRALDTWDYRVPFGRFHIRWEEGDVTPAFEQDQALAVAVQELFLNQVMAVWAHREVLVTFSSEYIQVGSGPAEGEPAWVVMVAGQKHLVHTAPQDYLGQVAPGSTAIVQALIHARTGEVLLGTGIPVDLQRR
jgi:hypothetical protein